MDDPNFFLAIIIGSAVILFIALSIKIIPPSQKGLVERLGKLQNTRNSGLTIIIPFIDKLHRVDIREMAIDVPPQEVICRDNVVVTVDCVIYIQVIDPIRAIYNVTDFTYAVVKLAQTNLRAVIGQMTLDETLSARESINVQLRTELDNSTDTWGVKVQRVEVQRIDPPGDVVNAMHQQMKAEREKRALILTAEGQKQSAILSAEGQRQSVILSAEGQKQSSILNAEGQRQAKVLWADGERQANILQSEGVARSIELESLAAIEFFHDGAVQKEQLAVLEKSLHQNTKYVFGSDIFDAVRGIFQKTS